MSPDTKKELLSIIVPCYNEEEVLPLFYSEVTAVLENMDCDYELLFVDDGSSDGSLKIMKELAGKNPKVFYYSFSRNFGKEAGIYAGLQNARGDYVVFMDADLQDPPSLLPTMMDTLRSGEYDSVATLRETREGEPPVRSFFARAFYRFINRISSVKIKDGARDFRMMNRKMTDAILSMCEYNRFSKGIFSWVGFRTHWIAYQNKERAAGTTKWSFWGLAKYAFEGIINFSEAPLSFISFLGFFMTIASFVYLIYTILRKLIIGNAVSGWATIVCIVVLMSGVQFLCIGLIGKYVAKTYLETKNRPIYIISETNRKKEDGDASA